MNVLTASLRMSRKAHGFVPAKIFSKACKTDKWVYLGTTTGVPIWIINKGYSC
jgi:hypothetical protein